MDSIFKTKEDYDRYIYTMMMLDPNHASIPKIQTPEWIIELGKDLKRLFDNKILNRMYFNSDGVIQVE